MTEPKETGGTGDEPATTERREALKRLGRFVAVTAPTVTLLMAAKTRPAKALPTSLPASSRQFKTGQGAVDITAVLATIASGSVAATINPIDGIGMCLAAIKGLNDRIRGLELQTAAL